MIIYLIVLVFFSFYTLSKIIYTNLSNSIGVNYYFFLLKVEILVKKNYIYFFSFFLNILLMLISIHFTYFHLFLIEIITDLMNHFFYSSQTFCMENESKFVHNFPIRNISINFPIIRRSSEVDLDGLLQLTDEFIPNRELSLLIQSGSNIPINILPNSYSTPCSNITQELISITNRILYNLKSCEQIGGLSRTHFLEFLQNFNSNIDMLKYYTSKSFYKINLFYNSDQSQAMSTLINILNKKGNIDFAYPIIGQFAYNHSVFLFNSNIIYFYSLLTCLETSTQESIVHLQSSNSSNTSSTNIIINDIRNVNSHTILNRAQLGDNFHFPVSNPQSLALLKNNNFILRS